MEGTAATEAHSAEAEVRGAPQLSIVLSTGSWDMRARPVKSDAERPWAEQRLKITFGDVTMFLARGDAPGFISEIIDALVRPS